MGTTTDKINNILNTKENIKLKLNQKGVAADDSVPFSQYPDKMDEISGANTLKSGAEINFLLKSLIDSTHVNPADYMTCINKPVNDYSILNILYSDSPPPENVATVTLDFNSKWIAWRYNSNTIYIYSEEDYIYMNYNSSCMFKDFQSLINIDLHRFNSEKVTNMSWMFYGCYNLVSLDLSSFNTSNVQNMSYMFHYCEKLESIDLSSFNTKNVTNMKWMFYKCAVLSSLDLSNFDTSKTIDMSYMFNNCAALNFLNLSNFDTTNVLDMAYMFNSCKTLESIDLSNFNTINVTEMKYMFSGCPLLTTIYCNYDWYKSSLSSDNMFYKLTNLVGAIAYDNSNSKVDAKYANPDTGYFTRKE